MAKRTDLAAKKLFDFDLEALLTADFSQDDHNDVRTSSPESVNPPKKFKSKDNNPPRENKIENISLGVTAVKLRRKNSEENEELNDVTKFFENVGNDFNKSMQIRKIKLEQFTESIISVYQGKIAEVIQKQETEVENFKKQMLNFIQEEVNKCEDEFKKLKVQENKLMRILEQQLKILQKTTLVQGQWLDSFAELHKNYVQSYEEMKNKHKIEVNNLKKSISAEVSILQSRFLREAKKEEMDTMKKYLGSVYL